MKKGKIWGIVFILIGAFLIYWAQTHSPQAGLGEQIVNEISGSYTMDQTSYYICLGMGVLSALAGLMKLVR